MRFQKNTQKVRCLDKKAILDCTLCSLHKDATNKVIGKGSLTPKILFIGEAPGCISGESLIDTAFRDKSKYPDGIPIKDLVGKKDFYVYSYDSKENKIVLGKVKKVWKTGKKKVFKVSYKWWFNKKDGIIEKENSIKVSSNHLFLLKLSKKHDPFKGINKKGEEYLSIENGLKINHSLKPFYRRNYTYSFVGESSNKMKKESRFLFEFKIKRKLKKGEQCHHKDGNKLNDSWDNLELLMIKEHSSLHTKGKNNCMNNPEIKKKHNKIVSSEEYKRNLSMRLKEAFNNPILYYNYLLKRKKISVNLPETWVETTFKKKFPKESIPTKDNHKVFCIQEMGFEDVYDIEVDEYHNFAVNGIFVHNSKEDKTGIPFVGPAGKQLDKMAEYLELSKKDYAVVNVLKCKTPGNRDPTSEEIETCKPFLKSQIKELNPKVIILLGNVAEKAISIVSLTRGKIYMFSGIIVIKVYHPAALLYQASRIPEQKQYLDRVREWLQ